MTPEAMAALHATAFDGAARWSAAGFKDLLGDPHTFEIALPDGFLIGRVVAEEAELLTVVVSASARRRGIGQRLVEAFAAEARARGAVETFLEVAADNTAALRLYRATGWVQAGHRRGYYGGTDALILRRGL